MKKILIVMVCILLVGCRSNYSEPTKVVESYLSSYQMLDKSVLEELDKSISNSNMNSRERSLYKSIMERGYQGLAYKIKSERVVGDRAIVDVEIEVFDYATIISNARKYYKRHSDINYYDYVLDKMSHAHDKIKYDIVFELSSKNDNWYITNIDDDVLKKVQGLY